MGQSQHLASTRHDRPADPGPRRDASLTAPIPAGPVPLPPSAALRVGSTSDAAEADADRMADAALARLGATPPEADAPSGAVHRSTAPATSGAVGPAGGALDPTTSGRIEAERANGKPLAGDVRGRMQRAFGADLGGVRVHDGPVAAALSSTLSATAFTHGNDIYFGSGAYRPNSPDGEHVLAHELAHVLQGRDTVHRWPWSKKDEDPAEKQRKDEEKAAKEKAKAEEKAKVKLAKATAKENKKLEKGEKAELARQRTKGVAKRNELSKQIAEESRADKTTSTTHADLNQRFEEQLALEKETFAHLVNDEGMDEEEARERSYQIAWIWGADPALNAVRPPRETAAERLTSDVRKARLEDKADDDAIERGRLGTMLSKSVEKIYEEWELEAERLRKGPPVVDAQMADYLAGQTVWGRADAEVRKKRPTDPRVERQARVDARNRLAFGKKPAKTETSAVDDAQGVTDKLDSYGNKALTGISKPPAKILAMIGKPIDKSLAEKADGPSPEKVGAEKLPIIGEPMYRVHHGLKNDPTTTTPISVETQASNGISSAASVLGDIFSAVNGVMKVVQSIMKASEDPSPRTVLGATKACNDGAKTAVSMARDAAELAKAISPGVSQAVGSFVPGLNIAISVMSIVSSAITLADMAMRMSETNQSLFDARGRTPGAKKVDVLVYPLLHVQEGYAKKLEQASWTTAVNIANLITSVATIASGGGYGVPVAVQAGVKVVDLLHSLGHFIADQVIVGLAKQSRVDALQSLEGAAENQLVRDPSMSVDGIVVRAKKGDAVAIKFLEGYGVKQQEVADGKLGDIRKKVLDQLGEDADPKYVYETYKEKIGSVLELGAGISGKWASTGELAKDRNTLDPKGDQRGWGWRVKMMFKGSTKFQRSKAKTAAQKDSKDKIACRVGKVILLGDPSPTEIGTFVDAIESLPDSEILNASANPDNEQEWRELLIDLLQSRIAKAKTPAKVGG